jgi:hypothetical protein
VGYVVGTGNLEMYGFCLDNIMGHADVCLFVSSFIYRSFSKNNERKEENKKREMSKMWRREKRRY